MPTREPNQEQLALEIQVLKAKAYNLSREIGAKNSEVVKVNREILALEAEWTMTQNELDMKSGEST